MRKILEDQNNAVSFQEEDSEEDEALVPGGGDGGDGKGDYRGLEEGANGTVPTRRVTAAERRARSEGKRDGADWTNAFLAVGSGCVLLSVFTVLSLAALAGYTVGVTRAEDESYRNNGLPPPSEAGGRGGTTKEKAKWWWDRLADMTLDLFRPDPPEPDDPEVKFVFFMGLEGTGHDSFEELYSASPSRTKLEGWGVFPGRVADVANALYDERDYAKGLWSAPCVEEMEGDEAALNGTALLLGVADRLQSIYGEVRSFVERERNSTAADSPPQNLADALRGGGARKDPPVAVPLNAVRSLVPGMGHTVYPTFRPGSTCRSVAYPDLDSLYGACDVAGVTCEHVLGYVDPYSLAAFLRRGGSDRAGGKAADREMATIMAHLSLMLDAMRIQIEDHPDRIAACWNLDASIPRNETFRVDDETGTEVFDTSDSIDWGGGVKDVGELLGWRDPEEFAEYVYDELYAENPPMTEEEKEREVPSELEVYMSAVVRANERLVLTCRRLLRRRKDKRRGRTFPGRRPNPKSGP